MSTNRIYLPWVRRGLAGTLETHRADQNSIPARAKLDVAIDVAVSNGSGSPDVRSVPVDGLSLLGPGDATALHSSAIARVEPAPGTVNFPPHHLPLVELTAPDLPWMLTPVGPDSRGRLQPWIILVCVREQPGITLKAGSNGMSTLRFEQTADTTDLIIAGAGGELPDPLEAWAWAHTEMVSSDANVDASDYIARHPERVAARLMCPRNLAPRSSYIAAVIPLFEAGRLSALGQPVPDDTAGYAWSHDAPPQMLELPVFHSWRFATGTAGDFESLARLLHPVPMPADVGVRTVDMQRPGFTMPQQIPFPPPPHLGNLPTQPFPPILFSNPSIQIDSALRVPQTQGVVGQSPESLYKVGFERVLNARQNTVPPSVGPPIYGRWHADREQLPSDQESPTWLNELNLDPKRRIAAGVGAAVVREGQENLMESAWSQYGSIEQINKMLVGAQLARAAGNVLYTRHLAVPDAACNKTDRPTQGLLALSGAVHSRIRPRREQRTIAAMLSDGGLSPARYGPAMRRLTRSGSASARVFGLSSEEGESPEQVTARNDDVFNLSPPSHSLSISQRRDEWVYRFREEISLLNESVEGVLNVLPTPPVPAAVPWESINLGLCNGLDPERTQVRRVHEILGRGVTLQIPSTDKLHPVIAAPKFEKPAYKALAKRSQDWIFAGLESVPDNAVALLETNPDFIESFMTGLNHEMGAELLFRGYPTDRQATPFRRFWDRRGNGKAAVDDLPPMTQWEGALGTHLKGAEGDAGELVVLIRGELLRRFPRTLIYAVPARQKDGETVINDDPALAKLPVFRGTLEPDVSFLGFELTRDEAIGGSGNDGWFFVIESQPTEPAFALDETLDFDKQAGRSVFTDWNTIYWGDLINGTRVTDKSARRAALDELSHIHLADPKLNPSLTKAPPPEDVIWGHNSAHMAFILLQLEVRLAFHAKVLLP